MYNQILVPTDGSAGMAAVIEHARSLAVTHGGTIHGLYVVDTGRFATLPVESSWEGVTGMLKEEGELALDELARIVDDDVPVEQSMVEGEPSSKIIEYATENNCDVIVMGTHGRSGLDRILLGSVAGRVIRQSPIPVVTVPVEDVESDSDHPESTGRSN